MHYVYVAGPISKGDVLLNIRRGIDAGTELRKNGFAPFVPHNDMIQYMIHSNVWDYETLLSNDFDWIRKCDAILRIPGESPGADREEVFAKSIGVPVFYNLKDLIDARDRSAN
jgi:hypothetical protein